MSGKRRSARLADKQKANSLDRERETPEALLNDLVLQNIFKFLGYNDLKSVRDVKNTIWLRNSKNAWWSRTKVRLTKENVEEYLNQPEISSHAKNYDLRNSGAGDFKGFWERCGHSVKSLKINMGECRPVDDFRQIIYTKCPNLEELVSIVNVSLNRVHVEPQEWQEPRFGQQKNLKFLAINNYWGKMPLSWMELLSHFPNLETLEANTKVDVCKVISIIRQHDPKMLKLKHIDIQGFLRADSEQSLRLVLLDPNLSFETLRIGDGIYRPETIVDILDLHAKSLKELTIGGDVARTSIQTSHRQPLLNLEKLNLTDCLFTADILRQTPNLRKFDLRFRGARDLLKLADSNLRCNSCKELTINTHEYQKVLPKSDFEFFLNVFPNVEILRMCGLDNGNFSMICERWTKLVSLTAIESEVDVFGLLGFNPNFKTGKVRNPNITNLKDLQRFSMDGKTFRGIQARGRVKMKMKNCDILLKELETLPQLKKFEMSSFPREVREKLSAKYSGHL